MSLLCLTKVTEGTRVDCNVNYGRQWTLGGNEVLMRLINYNKCTLWRGMLKIGEAVHVGDGVYGKISVPSN